MAVSDEILAGLFMKQGPGTPGAALGSPNAIRNVFQAVGYWDDGLQFDESIIAESPQDAVNKVFERFDPLQQRLTLTEIR